MEIKDLDHAEQLALIGAVELIGESNRDVTEEESAQISAIVDALGGERYRQLAAEADERFASEDDLRAHLRTISRQEARELIYGLALEVAMGDTIQTNESEFLDWLAREWGIEVRYDRSDGG